MFKLIKHLESFVADCCNIKDTELKPVKGYIPHKMEGIYYETNIEYSTLNIIIYVYSYKRKIDIQFECDLDADLLIDQLYPNDRVDFHVEPDYEAIVDNNIIEIIEKKVEKFEWAKP